VDFVLLDKLINTWILNEPPEEHFSSIVPVPVIPVVVPQRPDPMAALEAGEKALCEGRVAVFVVAGGQGTRLGFDGPKGSYSIGPITGNSLFQYHAEKIRKLQEIYQTVLPWYVMVSPSNEAATRKFFEKNNYWGLQPENILFFTQRMAPCVDRQGKLILDAPDQLAMSPNGHGGSIQALVDGGAMNDATRRGVDVISYFQVDNWAIKVADPYFIGYHCLNKAAMSSKCHRRNDLREAVGVHCLCDGVYRVIEYSELDLYPQLLEANDAGEPIFFAGNPAIHLLSVPFVRDMYNHFDKFPWHKAFKKIRYVDGQGQQYKPDKPNGYKFETFIFDALRFASHMPVALEINRAGEYTPIKQFEGANSVTAARAAMADYWGAWFEAAGYAIPRDENGHCSIPIEVSPAFALSQEEFVEKMCGKNLPLDEGIAVHADGTWTCGAGKS
jgi:UDP-N-acetylglucosamine/UDP-N-acetylgalactosamine diphosphorylase